MELVINHYSYVAVGLIVLGLLGVATWLLVDVKWSIVAIAITLAVLGSFQLMTSTNVEKLSNLDDFEQALNLGKPVTVQFYSNLWITCLSAKPAVDRLENELKENLLFIRLDISSELGADVRTKYHVGLVPSFIVFDGMGNEIWRKSGGIPDAATILSLDL